MTQNNNEHFVRSTQVLADEIGPGCFAQIGSELDGSIWVEVERVEGELLTGVVHYELSSSKEDAATHNKNQQVQFHRDDITHLGCGRFCFC